MAQIASVIRSLKFNHGRGKAIMTIWHTTFKYLIILTFLISAGSVLAQSPKEPFKPYEGQEGKDVVWVPTPAILVEKMLDLAKVTSSDFVMDLGSGDGRNIIAAARRGARALGVEYNPNMVELSRRSAATQGVADKAQFVQGDMFEADISQATVLALFLLPDNLRKLTAKFLDMKPGSRIVANYFGIEGWSADETEKIENECVTWCTALLYIVPAKVAGNWRLPQGVLTLEQNFQMFSGSLSSGGAGTPITNGRLRGDAISFHVGGIEYTGRISGNTMSGVIQGGGTWTATRVSQ
jgi:SAM-dependent methyltransferase